MSIYDCDAQDILRALQNENCQHSGAAIQSARRKGINAGKRDAFEYDNTDSFEETANPYGMDSEPELHEAWACAHENSFEENKRRTKTSAANWSVTICRNRYKIESNGRAVAWIDIDSRDSGKHARMIAALPRLLAACESALRVFQGWVHDIDPHNDQSRTENADLAAACLMCEMMSAAIKEAVCA